MLTSLEKQQLREYIANGISATELAALAASDTLVRETLAAWLPEEAVRESERLTNLQMQEALVRDAIQKSVIRHSLLTRKDVVATPNPSAPH